MQRRAVRFGAIVVTMLFASPVGGNEGTLTDSVRAQGNRAVSPSPATSPGVSQHDRGTGEPEVGIGRATGAVKSSGDEGGTAAGMPSKGAESGR
jgi:hypothetical protein